MKSLLLRTASLALVLGALSPVSAQVLIGPSPYLSFADSPFSGVPGLSYFHLENFESNTFTPGWTANTGWVRSSPSPTTDSVDSDDGAIDGSGAAGRSFYSGNVASRLVITFDASVLGALPTHAGIVWTDVGISQPSIGLSNVSFEAFDSANQSLGVIGPSALGDGSVLGGTGEDRFFGVIFAGGISRIELVNSRTLGGELSDSGIVDWEADHLQYGGTVSVIGAVPEPATTGILAGAGLLAAVWLHSRRRGR